MVKYLIKKHCVATERCTVSQNREQDYYYGKDWRFLSRDFLPAEEAIRVCGYDSEVEAKARLEEMKQHIPMESAGYWDITVEIISVEV